MINATQHEMAKWLAELLKPVLNKYSTHTTKDTFEFVDDVGEFGRQQAENSGSLFLCSFDVVSLFTNVPLKETISIAYSRYTMMMKYQPRKYPKIFSRSCFSKPHQTCSSVLMVIFTHSGRSSHGFTLGPRDTQHLCWIF